MKLTTKGRYAVTAMLDLAFHGGGGPVKLAEISERQGISLSYLEQLFTRLRKEGLVASTRGPGGGYSLGHPSDQIAVADIIEAVDESVDTTRCGGLSNCHNDERCLTHDLWTELSDQIRGFLSRISLGDLMARGGVREVADRQDRAAGKGGVVEIPVPFTSARV
ncbi:MAG: Fe-S cluster assembly transcription factor [Gammaproteobacteria bacterium]|nr:Fe-S cluster assembly transcription factor [Gammaproteobacteria bacterium]